MQIELPTRTVEQSLSQIALESSLLSNAASSIATFFPDLMGGLKGLFDMSSDIPKVTGPLTSDQRFVVQEIQSRQWLTLADLEVQGPESFKGSYVDYGHTLVQQARAVAHVVQNVLQPFNTYLSQIVSNKDAKISTKDMSRLYAELAKMRTSAIADINKFRTGHSDGRVKIGEVLGRKADVAEIYLIASELTKALSSVDLKIVQESVRHSVDLLNVIMDQAQKGDLGQVSPEVTQNLAIGAAEVAHEIEYVSILHFRAMGYVGAVDSVTDVLTKFIKGQH